MIIGVDFDNTIVCYDGLFHKLAVEQGLMPASVAAAKDAVRDYLRQIGKEDRWTELQGHVYGPGMREAQLFPGVVEFFDRCRRQGVEVYIISHRTRYPFLGTRHDLHQAARDFLVEHGFTDPARIGLPADHIFFHETKAEKIAQINAAGCTQFIDDLPEILTAPELGKSIERILFDPSGQHFNRPGLCRIRSWAEVEKCVDWPEKLEWAELASPTIDSACNVVGLASSAHPTSATHSTTAEPAHESIAALLAAAGMPQEFVLTPLSGGGNNRVYRVECEGQTALLKAYFHHPDDPRDRLAAEFAFSRFAWDADVRSLPQPLARDDEHHLGLYEFVQGRTLKAGEIGAAEVDQAADFFAALNQNKRNSAAAALRAASEACFTLQEHLDCVERRVQRLRQMTRKSQLDHLAADWVESKFAPAWFNARRNAERQADAFGLALDEALPAEDRCISPSDFGFHNAILDADSRLRFIDFEYAGWDDPAKTVCDFLCQPRLPVAEEFADRFTLAVLADCSHAEMHRRRVELLLPIYRLKWCSIMMNEFLPVGSRRREFARDADSHEQRKRQQLEKSGRFLQCIEA
jgi:hypothetical protein